MSSLLRLFVLRNPAPLVLRASAAATFARHQQPAAHQTPPVIRRFLSVAAGPLRCSASESKDTSSTTTAADEHNPLDRTRVVTLEQALRYQASEAYAQTYGTGAVWEQYRRNHKGPFAPRRTRKTCVRKGHISTGNPCPICRDEYLLLDHRNLELLQQFISPHTGEVSPTIDSQRSIRLINVS